MNTGIANTVFGLLVFLTCVFLVESCSTPAGVAKRESRRHRDELTERKQFASPFHKSIYLKYGEDRSREKVLYEAQIYLLQFVAERSGSNSIEMQSYNDLLTLDVSYDSVAVSNLFDKGLSSLDPTFGIEVDSFSIKQQIAERVDWILEWGGYAPGENPPFDQLGQRVIRGGIPEVLEIGGSSDWLLVKHPNNFGECYYITDSFHHYREPKTLKATKTTDEIIGIDDGFDQPVAMRMDTQDPMEIMKKNLMHYQEITTKTPYTYVDIMLDFFQLPCTYGPNHWAGTNSTEPWTYTRAGIDLRANLNDLGIEYLYDSLSLNIIVVYQISRVETGKVIVEGDFKIDQAITGVSLEDGIYVRMYTAPFHTGDVEDEGLYKLSVEVTHNDKKRVKNQVFDIKSGIYDIMLVSESESDPDTGVPEFKRHNPNGDIVLYTGKKYKFFMPVTGLFYREKVYYGEGDVLFVSQKKTGTGRTFIGNLVQLGNEGAKIPEDEHRDFNTLRQGYSDLSLGRVFIKSKQSNQYFIGNIAIPMGTSSDRYTIIVPVLSMGPDGIEIVTEGYLDVIVAK